MKVLLVVCAAAALLAATAVIGGGADEAAAPQAFAMEGERATSDAAPPARVPAPDRSVPPAPPPEPAPAPVRPAATPATTPAAAPAPAAAPSAPAAASARPCRAGEYKRMRTQRIAHAAVVRGSAEAVREPGGTVLARFDRLNQNGVATVFGVLGRVVGPDCAARWYRVQLPMKPNGSIGYVRAADVQLIPVRTRVLVELAARRVTLFRNGRRVFAAHAAIGSSATPTPLGNFYVNQRLRPTDPTGPFGPGAVGISAFSEVLNAWAQGGPVALHGTNRPDLIGGAVSNGCIRLRNDVLERLFAQAVPGTPVVIRP